MRAHELAWRAKSVVLLLTCLSAVVLAQTFQYSRGWTNGKRGGSSSPVQPGASWNNKLAPCQMRLFVGGRDTHQLYFPCEMFRHIPDDVTERYRRKPTLEIPQLPIESDTNNEEDNNINMN